MYNDQFMYAICTLAIYAISVLGLPLTAAFLFSVAMSIRADGTLLYIPAFLTVVFSRYGPIHVTACLALIIAFQYHIALPFILEGSGESNLSDYLDMSKLLGGDGFGRTGWGASQDQSIYWHFLPQKIYYSYDFLSALRYLWFFLTVYFLLVK